MQEVYFIGVDGGGTRCRARLEAASATVLAEAEGGSANVSSNAASALAEIVKIVRGLQDQVPVGAAVHIGLGLAGIVSTNSATAITEQVRQQLPAASITVDSDALIACLGAHGGGDGGIVIAGTGSAAFALVAGRRHEFGGWGMALGDEGSGALLGRAAVRHAIRSRDGLAAMGAMSVAVLQCLGTDRDGPIAWAAQARPADYAAFAPAVLAAAAAGDAAARAIIDDAAADLQAMVRRTVALGAPMVSLVGGLAQFFRERLPPDLGARHRLPLAEPVAGAVLLARQAVRLVDRVQ